MRETIYLSGFQPLTDEEFRVMKDCDERPVCTICLLKNWLESYVCSLTDYKDLPEFLDNYTWDESEALLGVAKSDEALLFTWCDMMRKLYVPEGAPEETIDALADYIKHQDTVVTYDAHRPKSGVIQKNVAIVNWFSAIAAVRKYFSDMMPGASVDVEREETDAYITISCGECGKLFDGFTADSIREKMQFIFDSYGNRTLDSITEQKYGSQPVLEDFFDEESPEYIELPVTISAEILNSLLHLWGINERFSFVHADEENILFVYSTNAN